MQNLLDFGVIPNLGGWGAGFLFVCLLLFLSKPCGINGNRVVRTSKWFLLFQEVQSKVYKAKVM